MHLSSYQNMARLVDGYLAHAQAPLILDLGSYDVNGSYRPLFDRPGWRYLGIDLVAGPNVDIVLKTPYRLPLPASYADVIISGQVFEHIAFFWLTWMELVRTLKTGGLLFLIAPSRGPEHRYPVDCWRFYPDGFRALADYAALELLEVHTDWTPDADAESAAWGDTVGVFRKKPVGWRQEMRLRLMTLLGRILLPGPGQ